MACWQMGYARNNASWGEYSRAGTNSGNVSTSLDVTAEPILLYAFCNGGWGGRRGITSWQMGCARNNASWGEYTGMAGIASSGTFSTSPDVTADPILLYTFCNGEWGGGGGSQAGSQISCSGQCKLG